MNHFSSVLVGPELSAYLENGLWPTARLVWFLSIQAHFDSVTFTKMCVLCFTDRVNFTARAEKLGLFYSNLT